VDLCAKHYDEWVEKAGPPLSDEEFDALHPDHPPTRPTRPRLTLVEERTD
jgi:hypothetical protein